MVGRNPREPEMVEGLVLYVTLAIILFLIPFAMEWGAWVIAVVWLTVGVFGLFMQPIRGIDYMRDES